MPTPYNAYTFDIDTIIFVNMQLSMTLLFIKLSLGDMIVLKRSDFVVYVLLNK